MTKSRIQEMAKPYMEYDMIQSHTSLPDFPESRARLLLAFLNAKGIQEDNRNLFALVTSLVQIALDTHDQVPESNELKEQNEARSRQLKVLAGAYFSSRFYNLLSQAGQIDMIRQLSLSICEVNRMKMNLYLQMKHLKLTAEEYLRQSVNIKTQLFLSFSKMISEGHRKLWPEILTGFTKCEVLVKEILRAETPNHFRNSWGFWHMLQFGTKEERSYLLSEQAEAGPIRSMLDRNHIIDKLSIMLNEQLDYLKECIRRLEPSNLSEELTRLRETYYRYAGRPQLLEEI
ncbi:heptaprenyl diphosphate synthase component 1 [Paenibacillus sp. J2TS4]|uniref:heptaprenyl diphosphate synthase component 1 n=1 Tax=Paenibacillus sp. J2TS4 TaxID=2807194 RepID=UPI001B20F3B7|nr:heptaprenyl diphosphate synthase component 1 [Paenibacillus sp. J2TS4]GIP32387.1 hypothetical protein J2TS4_15970 [Paenibacillus sp. J2TS4]